MKTYVLKHQDRATKPVYIVGADGIDVDHSQSIEQFIEKLSKSEMIQFHSISVYNNEVYHTILTEDYKKYFSFGNDTVLKLLNDMEATPSNQWDKTVGFERSVATNETVVVDTVSDGVDLRKDVTVSNDGISTSSAASSAISSAISNRITKKK